MSYSAQAQAKEARERLGKALAALQEDPNIPPDVMAVASNIAQAVGALFEAERASTEPDGKASVRSALGSLSQTLALLQDVRSQHRGIEVATEVIAKSMSTLYPLTTVPSKAPSRGPNPTMMAGGMQPVAPRAPRAPEMFDHPPAAPPAPQIYTPPPPPPAAPYPAPAAPNPFAAPQAQPVAYAQTAPLPQHPVPAPVQPPVPARPSSAPPPPLAQARSHSRPPPAPAPDYRGHAAPREHVEVNIGATTESNFYVGFSGEVSEGGVFLSTYEVLDQGTRVHMLVTLPGGFEFQQDGYVRFVRDPMDFSAASEPGIGVQFEGLSPQNRDLVLRFVRKRPPMFYDD